MLIKVYTREPLTPHFSDGTLHIIDSVEAITVHPMQSLIDKLPEIHTPRISNIAFEINEKCEKSTVIYIDFTRNGERTRVGIFHKAYICNNEGKTVQKIEVPQMPS